ncbi:hypothetical protein B1757_04720, partial [Acidithiobacillus marinus]
MDPIANNTRNRWWHRFFSAEDMERTAALEINELKETNVNADADAAATHPPAGIVVRAQAGMSDEMGMEDAPKISVDTFRKKMDVHDIPPSESPQSRYRDNIINRHRMIVIAHEVGHWLAEAIYTEKPEWMAIAVEVPTPYPHAEDIQDNHAAPVFGFYRSNRLDALMNDRIAHTAAENYWYMLMLVMGDMAAHILTGQPQVGAGQDYEKWMNAAHLYLQNQKLVTPTGRVVFYHPVQRSIYDHSENQHLIDALFFKHQEQARQMVMANHALLYEMCHLLMENRAIDSPSLMDFLQRAVIPEGCDLDVLRGFLDSSMQFLPAPDQKEGKDIPHAAMGNVDPRHTHLVVPFDRLGDSSVF